MDGLWDGMSKMGQRVSIPVSPRLLILCTETIQFAFEVQVALLAPKHRRAVRHEGTHPNYNYRTPPVNGLP